MDNIMNKNTRFNKPVWLLLFLTIISLYSFDLAYAKSIFKVQAKYGQFYGKGDGDNEFEMTPGVTLSLGSISPKGGGYWTLGYQELENTVGNSTAKGKLYTASQFDVYIPIKTVPNLFWSIGFGWDMMEFDNTSDFDHMGTIPLGLLYRLKVWKRYMDFSATARYVYDNSLGQEIGYDFAISLPFK
jgi:hypothetical protein